MNLRPAITVPRPWSRVLSGRLFDKRSRARRRKRRRRLLKFPRSLRFTTEGKWFIGILLVIAVAALNTGNNLLYLVVATLLSLIIISGVMSESTLRKVRPRRVSIPRRAFKDSPVPVVVEIRNEKRLFPSFSFHVREIPVRDFHATPVYVLKLLAGKTVTRTSSCTFKKRGQFTLYGLKVSTRFPFGLFVKAKDEESQESILVYPAVKPLKTTPVVPSVSPTHGETHPAGKGDGTELYGLKDYTPEDDSRHIHWKRAASTGRLLVKEYENERENRVVILFENFGGEDE
ncbi:MAG: DUF58 domain-containing protein, partial [Thermodesulfobacteriota bacterium]